MKNIYAGHMNSYHGFSFEEGLKGISQAGFKYCELAAVKGWTEHIHAGMTQQEKDAAKALLKKYDITPIGMSGHCNLMDEERLGDFERNIALAAEFGCKYIISSTGEAHFGKDESFTNEGLINNIKKIVPVLEKYNVIMALEVHGEHNTGSKLHPIIEGVGSKYVGIAYDTANCYFYGKVMPDVDLDSCINDVVYVHLKDHKGADDVWDFPGVGNGELPLKKFMDKLSDNGFEGAYSIEIEYTESFTMRDKNPEDIAVANKEMKDSFDYLKKLGRV